MNAMFFAPGGKLARCRNVRLARVRIADICGEEFQRALGRLGVTGVQRRQWYARDPVLVLAPCGPLFWKTWNRARFRISLRIGWRFDGYRCRADVLDNPLKSIHELEALWSTLFDVFLILKYE